MQSGLESQYKNIVKSAEAVRKTLATSTDLKLLENPLAFPPFLKSKREFRKCSPALGPTFVAGLLWKIQAKLLFKAQVTALVPVSGRAAPVRDVVFWNGWLLFLATVEKPARAGWAEARLLWLRSYHWGRFSKAFPVLLALYLGFFLSFPLINHCLLNHFSRDLECLCSEVWWRHFTNLELYCLELEAYILW